MTGTLSALGSRRLLLQRAVAAAVSGCTVRRVQADDETSQPVAPREAFDGTAIFDQVWQTVRDKFYDPHLHGLDWAAVRDRYRPEIAGASSEHELAVVINRMLSELRASHTRYYSADEPEYYQLADIFSGALRRRGLESAFPGGHISYPGIGIVSHSDEGRHIVTGVIDGTPARQAGLLAGDQIEAADGSPFQPVGSFRGKAGKPVMLLLRRAGQSMQLPVVPAEIEPGRMFLDGMVASARVVHAGRRRIGYVHVWCYAGYAYQRALERLLSEGVLKDADALIWDLRDGWGGAIPDYLDLFNARAPTMQVTDRDGASQFENVKWRKPVAMLVNGGTRSGKEVLAYGFKKYGLGDVIGTRTEGAVLAATAFLIGNGLLLLAVEDVRVDGERLEGVGVAPTIEVPAGLPATGEASDPQLDRALAVLSGA